MNPLFIVLLTDDVIPILFLLGLAIMLFRVFRAGFNIIRTKRVKRGEMDYSTEAEIAVNFQLSNFSYYRKLTPQGKKEFVQRVLNFMESHTIDGEDDFSPSLPEKIHVSAAATQLTFGLPDFFFTHFETVILYPGIFRMREDGPLMKGAVTPNGVIRISIRDFKEGYANPTDKLNVGLHEFGHALFMEFLKRANADEEGDEQLKNDSYNYIQEADEILEAGKHKDTFLRDYAFTNRHEFFAVSVEHFFEAPKEFKEQLPKIYDVMKILLNQDPAGEQPDYGILFK